jgi:hypothetical protein
MACPGLDWLSQNQSDQKPPVAVAAANFAACHTCAALENTHGLWEYFSSNTTYTAGLP